MHSTEISRRPEHRLLLKCVRWATHGEAPPSEPVDIDVPDGFDWEYFARQAWGHSMAAPAHRWLADRPLDVPEPVETALADRAERATYDALEMVRTLHRVFDVLEASDVRALPYKGPALRAAAYDDVAFREAADIDILVPRMDVRAARAALLEAGFEPRNELDDLALRTHVRGARHTAVVSESDVIVELHWRVTAGQFPFPVDFERLWARREAVEVGGEPLPTMRPTDHLALLSAHGNRHGWRGLCWLCDFAAAVRTFDVEWERLLRSGAERGGERMLLVGYELADRLLDVDPPATVERRRIRGDAVDALASRVEERFLWTGRLDELEIFRYRFAVRERWRDRARWVFQSAVLPSRNDVGVLPEPVRYYSLAVAVRPFRLVGEVSQLLVERVTAQRS
jgi:hypothetical protein